jgi:hypothetical protein
MISVEAFQVQENHLVFYPQLCVNDVGKFAIRDCVDRHLIVISNDEQSINESIDTVNKYNEEH